MKTIAILLIVLVGINSYAQTPITQTTSIDSTAIIKENRTVSGSDSMRTAQKGEQVDVEEIKPCEDCKTISLFYDFRCKKFYYYKEADAVKVPPVKTYIDKLKEIKLKYNESFLFKITDINRYIYDIDFKINDIEYTSEPSALFISNFGQGATAEKAAAPARLIDVVALKAKVLKFMKSYKELNNIKMNVLSDCYILGLHYCCNKVDYYDLINDYRIIKKFRNDSEEMLKKLTTKTDEYIKINDALREAKIESLKNCDKDEVECKKGLLVELDKQLFAAATEIEKIQKEIDNAQALITVIDTEMNIADITENDILGLIYFYKTLTKDKFEFTPEPIFAQGNKVNFNITFSKHTPIAKDKPENNITDVTNLSFDLYVRNKWFVSFSTGPFFTVSNDFKTDVYNFQAQPVTGEVPATAKYRLVKSGTESTPYGIAAFGNVGTKVSPFFGYGFSIGAGATVAEKVRQGYFFGPSLFFGNEKQFNLTLGMAFIQVDKLKTGLYQYPGILISDTLYEAASDVQYTKTFEKGVFFSVSYTIFNLSSTEKNKTTSTNPEVKVTTTTTTETSEKE